MAPGLQLSQRLTQSLVLAPQLQHSLALLQAPTLELKALVEHELEQNPVLEEVAAPETEFAEKQASEDGSTPAEMSDDTAFESASEKGADAPVDDFQAEFDKLVQLDQDWRDHFTQTNIVVRATPEDDEKRQFMFDSLTAEQLGIAELIIGNLDDYGYLKTSTPELSASTNLPEDKISEVLKTIQGF